MCAPTGSIIGVQNKSHTGKVAIVAALDATATPPATAQSEAIQQGLDEDSEKINTKPKSPDIDSLYSEGEPNAATHVNAAYCDKQQLETVSINDEANIRSEQNLINASKDSAAAVDSLATVFSVQLNVTDENGDVNEAEIYDPDSRGRDSRKLKTPRLVTLLPVAIFPYCVFGSLGIMPYNCVILDQSWKLELQWWHPPSPSDQCCLYWGDVEPRHITTLF